MPVGLAEPCAARGVDKLDLDRFEGEQCFAQPEGEGGSDLEDCEVITYQSAEGRPGLLVGRVRLVHELIELLDERRRSRAASGR
jgi:hypothetical protein